MRVRHQIYVEVDAILQNQIDQILIIDRDGNMENRHISKLAFAAGNDVLDAFLSQGICVAFQVY